MKKAPPMPQLDHIVKGAGFIVQVDVFFVQDVGFWLDRDVHLQKAPVGISAAMCGGCMHAPDS